jgi:hypothetical protein
MGEGGDSRQALTGIAVIIFVEHIDITSSLGNAKIETCLCAGVV